MLTVKELPNGMYDVQDDTNRSLLDPLGGPFRVRETAEAACRMLGMFDQVDEQIAEINGNLRHAIGCS